MDEDLSAAAFGLKMREILQQLNILVTVALLALINPLSVTADPVTAFLATWYGALALSAAVSAASYGINYLLRPKPKPQDKGKLQGDIQLSNVGEDIPITEIYGGRQRDNLGGIRTGLTCVWASPIRKVVVTVPGGGGGGKGGPRAQPGTENHYYQDFAFLAGFGPLKVLDLRANSDLLYSDYTFEGLPEGTKYEAETATLGGATFIISDAECSGGQGITTNNASGGGCTLGGITRLASEEAYRKFYISYKSRAISGDDLFTFSINSDSYSIYLPNSNGDVATIMVTVNLNVGSNTLTFLIRGGVDAPILDCFHVGYPILIDPDCPDPANPDCDGCFISGMRDPNYSSPSATFNNVTLATTGTLPDPCIQYNYQPQYSSTGVLDVTVANNVQIRIYEGNSTQTADPLLQAYFEPRYGAGSTPAYRHRCLIVIENFETTKFGGNMPNFTALLEHRDVKDLCEMYKIRAAKAGLQPLEYNFDDLNDVPLRGFAITSIQAPKAEMEVLNRIFDADIIQDANGVVKGVLPTYAVERTIPVDELDVVENWTPESSDQSPPVPVERTVRPDEELPDYLGVSFFDATRPGETAERHASRQTRASDGRANIETNLVMLPIEAEKFAVRELQKMWAQKDPMKIRTFWKHCRVTPSTVIQVEELDGANSKMLVQSVQGLIPSVYEITGVSCDFDELAPRPFETGFASRDIEKAEKLARFPTPAVVIGTVIDLMQFRSSENVPGVYVASAVYDQHYRWKGATLAWERDTGWETLTALPDQCTMGRTTGALGAVPGGWTPGAWDDTNSLQITLYYGELESLTDAQVLDRNNVLVVGDEVIAFGTAVLNNATTNTWTVSHLQRRLNGVAVTHGANERAVLMNSAVKFVPLDITEVGQARNYSFLAGGQSPADSLTTSHTFTNAVTGSTSSNSVSATASEALAAGDVVSFHLDSSVLKVRKADASDDTRLADGYVRTAVSSGATATVYTEDGTVVTGLTGLTIGTEYFLSETAGAITATAPTTTGAIVQRVGKALSATTLLFRPQVIAEIE